MKKKNVSEMTSRMAAYCSTTERCISDVAKKITAEEFSEEESEQIISYLIKENFINEIRFTRSFINDKLRFNKWGRIKVNYELQKKQIPSSIRSNALEDIDMELYQNILTSILKEKKKTTKGKDAHDEYNKLVRFALGRGFEMNEIRNCLKRLGNNTDYDDDLE